MIYNFDFYAHEKQCKQAESQKGFGIQLTDGFINLNTKEITINLDVLLERTCFLCGRLCDKQNSICHNKLIRAFSILVTHEHIHNILNEFDDGLDFRETACDAFDKIRRLIAVEY